MENKQLDTKELLNDDEERYHEREEYGHRERGRYGRY